MSRIVCYGRFGVGYDRSAEVYDQSTQPGRIELKPSPTNSASYLSSYPDQALALLFYCQNVIDCYVIFHHPTLSSDSIVSLL
ncbi:hypothetical protein [Sporosarcina sp. FSL K6-1508]|uniref:hypothetical protein n=1 Tax=Sporosarcina sp. FSL K6-1508 TaxID=2921553 RepID=UPI0030FB8474